MITYHIHGERIPALIAAVRLKGGNIERALMSMLVTTTDIVAIFEGAYAGDLPDAYLEIMEMARNIPDLERFVVSGVSAFDYAEDIEKLMGEMRESKSRIY